MRRLSVLVLALLLLPAAAATFPYPSPPAGVDPTDFAAYTFLPAGAPLPNDYAGGDVWKYSGERASDPALREDPAELYGVTGMAVDRAWRITTGRPDVLIAVLDSGIIWERADVRAKIHLNAGEIPGAIDRDGNGVLNVLDFEGLVPDVNGNGFVDGLDLIRFYSDGVDDDGNGYVDDIAGWNTLDDNNDPTDDVRYGHGSGEAEDSAGEADNGGVIPGTCPNCMILPVRVGMSFIATDNEFGEGVLFALAAGADVIQEALGTVDNTPLARHALRLAWERGVPVIASAADEASYHHNLPAAHEHTINVNSVTRAGCPSRSDDRAAEASMI
ncbi:MAG TPA: S8 family serine peptidase, partial [Candidatus Thermoplasmatota archaeon]|nr:S8 family serine peptidase [Candidatus Thermoplasmatota archaeon]